MFPGSNNVDQLYKIFSILGFPEESNWSAGYKKMIEFGIDISKVNRSEMTVKSILSKCDSQLISILEGMLVLDPKKRMKCSDIVNHPYFSNIKGIVPPLVYNRFQADYGMKS